jgi:hypothetical protein
MGLGVFKLRLSLRELRGLGIVAAGGQIERVNENRIIVRSRSVDGAYHNAEWTGCHGRLVTHNLHFDRLCTSYGLQ